ncbi:MAG: S49 family peptidase [Candidatus Delongbacteria bacterium]|nr:S49 family peptidase [Candidatus Delongbacteria bacterium]
MLCLLGPGNSKAQDNRKKDTTTQDGFLVYKLEIFEKISMSAWRNTQQAFNEADSLEADVFLIHMNTYGGLVVAADSIRTAILNADMPVWVYIDNNAASAGALISIACDKIFMKEGSSIGAATVVSQDGKAMPDKYQSYMRSTMRSTAEAHGKDTIINGNDTSYVWKRDPAIAEAMVDPDVYVPGVIDSTKVLTFTASEAVKHGFCDGIYADIQSLMLEQGISDYETKTFEPTAMDKILGFLTSPGFQGILVMLIIGGLYFELQSPGIGFPFIIAIASALLYFAPAYIEGLAGHWEILLFIAGVILIAVEIFVIPGFGVAGILGIAALIIGLAMSMVGEYEINPPQGEINLAPLVKALAVVIVASTLSFFLSIWLSGKLFGQSTRLFGSLALDTTQQTEEGYISADNSWRDMIGKTGTALSDLRPSGKIEIDEKIYNAKAINGYIEQGSPVVVKRFETVQLYVELIETE